MSPEGHKIVENGQDQGNGAQNKQNLIMIDEWPEMNKTENKKLGGPLRQKEEELIRQKSAQKRKFLILSSSQRSRPKIHIKQNTQNINNHNKNMSDKAILQNKASKFGKFGKKFGLKLRRR